MFCWMVLDGSKKRVGSQIGLGLLTYLLLLPCSAQEARYISDQLVVGVRSGPGGTFERIANLATGDRVIMFEDEQNDHVRIGLANGLEGWISTRYLTDKPPTKLKLQKVEQTLELIELEKERLIEVNRALKLDKTEIIESLTATESSNAALTAQLTELKELANQTQIPQEKLTELQKKNNGLQKENRLLRGHARALKDRRNQWWLLIGGGIAIVSLILGLLASRVEIQRKGGGPTWR